MLIYGSHTVGIFLERGAACIDRRQYRASTFALNLLAMLTIGPMMRVLVLVLAIVAVLPQVHATQHRIVVGAFSEGDLSAWKPKKFNGETNYRLVNIGDRKVLKATSAGSASGLVKRIKVDLTRTPILAWSWRVDDIFKAVDEHSKSGDDYPARIYVIVSGGLLFWRTRSLNYVWSGYQPLSSAWPNPYTDHVVMIAVASGSDSLGKWVHERRNVRADFRRYFGEDITTIDAVAVMTDTDTTSEHAVAYYGDIYFTPAPGH